MDRGTCLARCGGLLCLLLTCVAQAAGEELRLLRITPSGEDVPAERQIVFESDRPMVAVGNMARPAEAIPIHITPRVDCAWRWLNTKTLACQLGEDDALVRATRYEIVVAAEFESLSGARLADTVTGSFVTERPEVQQVYFERWLGPGTPVMRAIFNQDVSADVVARHLLFVHGQASQVAATVSHEAPATDAADAATDQAPAAASVWYLAPARPLPLDTEVRLERLAGLTSVEGAAPAPTPRTVLAFHTFPEFRFLGVRCYPLGGGDWALLPVAAHGAAGPRCNPMDPVALVFSVPVAPAEVRDHVTFTPDLAGGRNDYEPWANRTHFYPQNYPHQKGAEYWVWLPELLKAFQSYLISSPGGALADQFGRPLSHGFAMTFATSHRPPRLHLAHQRAVLEHAVDTDVPLYVTNLDEVRIAYTRRTDEGSQSGLSRALRIPDAEDVAFAVPLGARQMLGGASGALYARLSSVPPSVEPQHRGLFVQVTPFNVHVKLGHWRSLVWVTEFATGKPVNKAQVTLLRGPLADLGGLSSAPFASVTTDKHGIAYLPGSAEVDPNLDLLGEWRDGKPKLFVQVDKGEHVALIPLDSDFRVWPRALSAGQRPRYGHIKTWGVTAQGVYRAGDTIEYKFYAREQGNETLRPAPAQGWTLEILDPAGKVVHRVEEVALSEFGAYHGAYQVPETGAVGWYRFQLSARFSDETWEALRVLVSDFTPSPFSVTAELNGHTFTMGQSLKVHTRARLHAGGPYASAAARLVVELTPEAPRFPQPWSEGFQFQPYDERLPGARTLFRGEEHVDARGDLQQVLTLQAGDVQYGRLRAETAVRDDRGKYVAAAADAAFVGRDRFLGLKNTAWLYREDRPAELAFLVVDAEGERVPDVEATLNLERQVTLASRVKGAGNAYLTRYETRWEPVAACAAHSDAEGGGTCAFVPEEPGAYRIVGSLVDSQGRTQTSSIPAWVAGKGPVLWELPQDSSMAVQPEKAGYVPGETARLLVRNPYPGARALISIERYGVIDSWVQTLDSSTPVIELPIEERHLPGFYFSVVVLSPRVQAPLGPDDVDLGKPAFRLGYVRVPVEDPERRLEVAVDADADTVKPRQTVQVKVRAKPTGGGQGGPMELAVAVVDEAVLELLPDKAARFDPYGGFYSLDALDLTNFSLLTRLVGRQNFEAKGASPGGDGGAALSLRSLFKFVAYWNPSLLTDERGRADFEFQVPDNLTGWRIVVLAVTPTDRLGYGQARITVNQPTELRPAMPNRVLQGDRFLAGFSVMNRTDVPRDLRVEMSATGPGLPEGLSARSVVSAPPFERRLLWLPVHTEQAGEIRFTARAGDATDEDLLEHRLPVQRRRVLETAADYGSTTAAAVSTPLAVPEAIWPDSGDIRVVLSPTVIGELDGAFRYMRDYPYGCWEQRLSKAVMASQYAALRDYLPADLDWSGAATLPDRTLAEAANFQAPNGGMTYWLPRDEYVSAYLSAFTALAFQWLGERGHAAPGSVQAGLHDYLDSLLKEDRFPSFYDRGMAATVRALMLAALARAGRVTRADMERYRPHVRYMSLFGKAHYLQAARAVQADAGLIEEVRASILAHGVESGGKLQFNETLDDGYRRILATPLRSNCAVLETLVGAQATGTEPADRPFKMVRAITQARGRRDRWENTQENLFCLNALAAYAARYEAEAPDLAVDALLGTEEIGRASFRHRRDPPVSIVEPLSADRLGQALELTLKRYGRGRLYYGTRLTYAPRTLNAAPVNAGIDIRREYRVQRNGGWQRLESPYTVRRGELLRIDLLVSLPTVRHFVVVDDPVPGGLEPVNRELATASGVDARAGDFDAAGGDGLAGGEWIEFNAGRWSFYHQELRHEAARFFSDYLPPGNYRLSYTVQAIAEGRFGVMPAKAEEMYDPDVYGLGLPAELVVEADE